MLYKTNVKQQRTKNLCIDTGQRGLGHAGFARLRYADPK